MSYADHTCTDTQDIRISINKLNGVTLIIPEKQEGVYNDIKELLLVKELYKYVKRRKIYRQSKTTIYSVVIGKCTEYTKKCLEGKEKSEEIDKRPGLINLLKVIKII